MLLVGQDSASERSTPSEVGGEPKLPTTLEEFLEAEKLTDWPYPMALEGPLDIAGEGLLLGSQEDVAEILRESAPLGLGLLEDLEDRLTAVEDKLNTYAVHIVTDDKRPSRLIDRLFHSPSRTFMTEASNSDVVKSHYSSRGHKSADFADQMIETKKRSMEYCMFPGFRHGELVELPAQLEAPPLLHKITNIQNFNPGFRKFWKKLFLSEASAAVVQDSFWWIFLTQFNKERGFDEEKNLLFDRIADSYVALFTSTNADVKDKFLTVYPDCLAQALYSAYVTAFPESRAKFDDKFKQYLVNLTNEWILGLKRVPGTWRGWSMVDLEDDGSGGGNEANAATKKMMEAAALNKKMDVSLDLDGFHRVLGRLGEVEAETPLPESRQASKAAGASRLGQAAVHQAKRQARESHQIGPGPEYERVKFNTSGRSPLISHYLHMRQLRDYKQPGKKVRRTEIAKLPQPGPTYQQFIQNKMAVSDALSREYTRIVDSTNAEILELERKKREMYRDIDGLKRELGGAKSNAERKQVMDRIKTMQERDREGTPILDHRAESALTGSLLVSDED